MALYDFQAALVLLDRAIQSVEADITWSQSTRETAAQVDLLVVQRSRLADLRRQVLDKAVSQIQVLANDP